MTTRRLSLVIGLGLAVFASQCALALAQPGGRGGRGGQARGGMFGRMGGGSPVDLVLRDEVREELNLTTGQVENLEQLNEQQREQRRQQMGSIRDRFQGFQDLTAEERQERMMALQQEQAKQQQEVRKQVDEILNSQQRTRFAQLGFQYYLQRGDLGQALATAGVELSEADQTKLREAQEEIRQRTQEQIAEIQRKAQQEILATVVSSNKVEELTGDPFEFASRRDPRDARFGGNRPGRQQGDARPARPERPQSENTGGRRGRRQ